MKNLNSFLDEHKLKFSSQEQSLRWVRKLKPKSLVRIGISYFVDEVELARLLQEDFIKRQKLRSKRMLTGKKVAAKNLGRKLSPLFQKAQEKNQNPKVQDKT